MSTAKQEKKDYKIVKIVYKDTDKVITRIFMDINDDIDKRVKISLDSYQQYYKWKEIPAVDTIIETIIENN